MVSRSDYFDNVKFLLILLVIFGHIIPFDINSIVGRGTYNFIFSFHMPLFIFISGYFTKIDNREKFFKGIYRLAEALICFQLVHIFLNYLSGNRISFKSFVVPGYTLWYLYCLIYWRIVIYIIKPTQGFKPLVIAIFLCLFAGFIPLSSEMSFQRTFFFLPFFVLGYSVRSYDIFKVLSNLSYTFSFLFFVFFYIVSIVTVIIGIPDIVYDRDLLYGVKYYTGFPYPVFLSIIFRILYLLFAFFISICFLRTVPSTKKLYTKYGRDTLFFYLYHSILVLLLRHFVYVFSLPTSFFFCVLYFAFIFFILLMMKSFSLFYIILNPISNLCFGGLIKHLLGK